MKKSWVTLFAVIALFSVSGVYSIGDGDCKLLNQQCTNDTECCSGNCRKYFSIITKYCTDFHDHCLLLAGIKEMFIKPKFEDVQCELSNTTDVQQLKLDHTFGPSRVAYGGYLPNTVVTVKRGDKSFDVVVDDRAANLTGEDRKTFMLSMAAAEALGINSSAKVPCQVQSRVLNNHPVLKATLYISPAIGVVAILYAFVRFNVFATII